MLDATRDVTLARETRRAVEAGQRLLREKGLPAPLPQALPAIVWELFKEATVTLEALPDPDERFLHYANKTSWVEYIHTEAEMTAAENQRVVILKEKGKQIQLRRKERVTDITAEQRMHVVLGWLRYVTGRNEYLVRKAFVGMARGYPLWRVRVLMGCRSKSAPQMMKQRAIHRIVQGLHGLAL